MTRTSKHLDEALLRQRAAGSPLDTAAERHLEGCEPCQREALLVVAAREALTDRAPTSCPDPSLLLALHEGVTVDAREELDAHLTACLPCTIELEALARARPTAGTLPGPPSSVRRGAQALAAKLRALVAFDMPASVALTTRASGAIEHGFRASMERYRAGDLIAARAGLLAARAAGDQTRELPFFLGACLLREGQVADAVEVLAEAVKRNAKLGEYRFYYALALLAAGRGEEAVKVLRKAATLPGPFRVRARAMAKEVDAILAG